MSRPAIQQNESRQYRVTRLQTEVQRLTQSLMQEWKKKDVKTPGNVATLQDVRSGLCITLSDLILCDPQYAKTNNLVDKLWKNGFYINRVDLLRNKIMKCQIKIDRIQRQNPSEQRNSVHTDGNQNPILGNQSQDVAVFLKMKSDTKEALYLVLKEGLDFFKPLFDKLHMILMKLVKPNSELLVSCPETTQPFMLSGSYDDTGDCSEYLPESSDGIVDCLRRIQMIIGDMYRYLDSDEAKVWYVSSTWLAPGFGHAFNQLGVISQHPFGQANHPEQKLLHSLYFYSRAILAQEQGLRLASANTERLFFENIQLCQKCKNQKGTNAFLTNFIDMHYNLFLLLGPSASASASITNDYKHDYTRFTENDAVSLVETSISQSFSMLTDLLNKTALSDKLLCKLAVIQAFSVTYKGVNNFNSDNSKTNTYYAQRSTFKFAECLAERIITTSIKQWHNFSDTNTNVPTSSPITIPSVRLLLPFMLVTEYIFVLTKHDSIDLAIFQELYFDDFWKLFIKIANHYTQLASIFSLTATDDDDDDINDQDLFPDDYKTLRGFIPFQPFLEQLNPDSLLTDEEAANLLDSARLRSNDILTPQSAGSKESYGIISTRSSQEDQNRCKIKRFLSVCAMIASCNEINIVMNSTDGTFIWMEDGQEGNLNEIDSQSIILNPSSDIDDQVTDMILADERIENTSNAEETLKYRGLFDNSFNCHHDDGEEYDNASNGSTRTYDPDEVCNDQVDIEILTNQLASEVASGSIQIHMVGSIEADPSLKIIPTTGNQEYEIEGPNGDENINVDVDATVDVNATNVSTAVDPVTEEKISHPTDSNSPDLGTTIIPTTTNQESEIEDSNDGMNMIGDVDATVNVNAMNESTVADAVAEEKISHPTDANYLASPTHCPRLPSPSHLEANEETEILSMPTVKQSLSFETVDTGNDTVTETTEVAVSQQQELRNLQETMLCATGSTIKMSTVPPMQQDFLSRSALEPKPLSQQPSSTMATRSSSQNHIESLGPDLFSWHPPKKRQLLDILGDPDTFGGPQAYRTRNPFVNPIFHSDELTKEQIIAARPKSEVSSIMGHPRPRYNPLSDFKPKSSSMMAGTSFSNHHIESLEPDLFSWRHPKKSRLLDILGDPDTFGGPKAYRTRNPFVNPIFHSDELTKEQIIAARPKSEIIMGDSRPRWNSLSDAKPDEKHHQDI